MTTRSAGPQTRALLWIGFGGLIALLSFTGISALSIVRQVQIRNEKIRTEYIDRSRVLEQLRSDIYLSGTYVRDFLLEIDDVQADAFRQDFDGTRERIEQGIARYRRFLHPEEASVFNHLADELSGYFDALQPALGWTAAQRRTLGPAFTRDQVLRRRATMIDLAGKVGQVNERQLASGDTLVQHLFSQFRRRLLLVILLTLAVGSLLAAVSMYRILSLERETQERYREIAQARRESQDLSAKLVDAQEQERRSIARELHDEVGQSLSALLVSVGNLSKAAFHYNDPVIRDHINIIRTLGEKSVAAVRNMSLLLRPSMLDDLGLIPALKWQAREISRSSGIRVNVAADDISDPLPEDYRTCIYRIVQEALHNCQRHAEARQVRIQLQQTAASLLLSVQDDGRGFSPANRGLGLLGIEERVSRLKGRFEISSEDGQGTLLSIELPVPSKDAKES